MNVPKGLEYLTGREILAVLAFVGLAVIIIWIVNKIFK